VAEIRVLTEEPSTRGVLRRAWPYLRPHRWAIAVALLVTVGATLAVVLVAPAIGRGVDAIVAGDRTGLWWAVGVLVGLILARVLLLRTSELLLTRAGERVVRELRDTAVERLAAAPLRFIEAHRTGDLLRRTTGEIADLAQFIRANLPDLLGVGITLVATVVVLSIYSWPLTLLLLVVFLPAAYLVVRWFEAGAGEAFGDQAAAEATLAATFTETLSARETLQATGGMRAWRRRLGRDNDAVVVASSRTVVVLNRLELVALLEGAATAALLGLGVWLVGSGSIGLGTLVVFVLATANLFENVVAMSQLVGDYQAARIGLARLHDLLGATHVEHRQAAATLPDRGPVEVDGLRYAYLADTDVLHDVTVTIPAGDRVGLVGATGSGKTTLAKLITGLYRPDRGAVRFAGVDIGDVDGVELRRRVVLVPQQVHMISGTVADNLALAPTDPDRAAMERAAEALGLRAWVEDLEDGLDTDVGVRGERLSAGEQQLVGLLRAALVDPAVLVLDEATANLDPATAARIEEAVERLRVERTLIVIAHREATIDRLPRVVRLDAGRVL
jgi:ABC-type multidrug transport system fused ATPase/permease subunit